MKETSSSSSIIDSWSSFSIVLPTTVAASAARDGIEDFLVEEVWDDVLLVAEPPKQAWMMLWKQSLISYKALERSLSSSAKATERGGGIGVIEN